MSSAHKGVRTGRRSLKALPVAALAVGTAGLFLSAPAHADGASQLPAIKAAAPHRTVSTAELKARVAGAIRVAGRTTARSTMSSSTTSGSTSGGKATPLIIGGSTTTFANAPFMVQLYYYDDKGTADTSDDVGFACDGTIVSHSKILTAAHCVHGYDWYDYGAIVSGTDQLVTTNADGSANLHGGVISLAGAQWNHPSYNDTTTDNDAAVLTVDPLYQGLASTAKALPITSSTDTASYTPGKTAVVYGWGRTSSTSEDESPTLLQATLPVDSDATCTQWDAADFKPGHMVCAGTPASGSDTGTIATCNGDSGGPLVENGKIIGIVSWGVKDCVEQGAYSVFTKVSTYAGAINQRMDDGSLLPLDHEDTLADLFARTPAGEAYMYQSKGTSFAARADEGDFSGLNLVRQADLNGDWSEDLVVRTTAGHLMFLDSLTGDATDIGAGWNAMKSITLPGDITGDGKPDLFATDSTGVAYVYPGTGAGKFGARVKVGSGWNIYGSVIYGKGDLTDDGRADIVARDSSGVLWLYKGTGSASAPWAARVKIGAGWNGYNAFASTGDMTGDGKADLLARDTSGVLWLYKGTGSTSAPYAARVKIGAGWNIYNLLG
ncbi:trypsin-like serine protease [Actinacidiphila acidipaludis]|uniref:Trypsin-like serine protease n=1 Tax=Actinacidiphila acidipaludis TaxID=2873382 RepID=A0ABS7Q8W6_9ACTN|nr:trypsin-like serine protease [Streptomyces acidipaludis]MBY8879607.1 trypsin-like serine protease [Streptomyces acidipaludis]